MLMERSRTFPEVMLQTAIAAIACMLLVLPDQAAEGFPVLTDLLLFSYAFISYLCSRLFLHRPKKSAAVFALHLLLFLAFFGASFFLQQITGAVSGIFLGAVFLVLSVMSVRETVKGISTNALTLCFDLLVALLLIYTLFTELGDGLLAAALPGAVGIIASIAGMIALRSGGRIPGRNLLVCFLVLFILMAASFLVCLLADESLRGGLSGVFAAIGTAFTWLGRMLKELLLFFSRLFPNEQYEAVPVEPGGGVSLEGAPGGEEAAISPLVFVILGGILLAAAAAAAFLLFRKHRFFAGTQAAVRRKTAGRKQGRVSLRKALRMMLQEWLHRLRVRLFFLRGRNTPTGRYFRLVRSKRRTPHALRPGETPREFLQRYIQSLPPDDRRIPELSRLIDEFYAQLYG